MANSRDTSYPERDKIAFKVLDVLYSVSNGYKYTFIPFENLYKELRIKNDKEQELILEIFEYLRKKGLVDSKALATASITHQGIKEMENIMLGSGKHTAQLSLRIDKNEIKTIQEQRALFLRKAYELSKGSSMQPVSAFKIMDMLGYDKKTLERIYFYLEDEGLIKTFTLGGKFTITQKGTEQQADPKN